MLILSFNDNDSFEKIYNRYVRLMYSCAYDILDDKQLAEDAVQEAFIRLSKHLDRLDKEDTNRNINFVYTITKHIAINIYNKRKRADIPLEHIEPKEEYIAENYMLSNAMEALSEDERNVLVLKYVHGFSQKEIAKLLNINQSAAGVRIKRAKDKLLRRLGR